jgi:hypothetical protein
MDDMVVDGISLSHVALAKATQMVLNLVCNDQHEPYFICRLGEGTMDDMVVDGISLSHVALARATQMVLNLVCNDNMNSIFLSVGLVRVLWMTW